MVIIGTIAEIFIDLGNALFWLGRCACSAGRYLLFLMGVRKWTF